MRAKPSIRVIAPLIVAAIGLGSFGGVARATSQTPDVTASSGATASPVASASAKPPIASADDLRAYLATHRGEVTPFDAFGPAARADFIASIQFGSRGVSGFHINPFQDQLTDAQRIAILKLFGQQDEIADLRPEHELSSRDRQKARRIAELEPRPGAALDRIERSYVAFERVQPSPSLSDAAFRSLLRRSYRERFAALQHPATLRALADVDLIDLYRATNDVAFYTHDPDDARALLRDFLALQRRDLTMSRDEDEVLNALLASRSFAEAKSFAAQHRELGVVVPDFQDDTIASRSGPTELAIGDDAKRLVRRSFDFTKPAQVIVVSSPFCHFCQGAVRDIAAIPALERRMKRYSHWLALQDGSIGFVPLQRWNASHPAETMTLAYRETEWPMIDSWATPTFYFFKKKTLVAKMTGWPPEGRVAELERALTAIGAD